MANLGHRKSVLGQEGYYSESGEWVTISNIVNARDGTQYTKSDLQNIHKFWDQWGHESGFDSAQAYIDDLLTRPGASGEVINPAPIYETRHVTSHIDPTTKMAYQVKPVEMFSIINGVTYILNNDGKWEPAKLDGTDDTPDAKKEIPWIPISIGAAAVAAAFLLG